MEMGKTATDWVSCIKLVFWELQLENITDQAMIEILESQK
jgi:hypothetical protein